MYQSRLILIFTILFVILFYNANQLGLNFGIMGASIAFAAYFTSPIINRNTNLFIYFFCSILSSLAFAWYGDFSSFIATIISLLLLQLKAQKPKLSMFFIPLLLVYNALFFIFRLFNSKQLESDSKINSVVQKSVAYFLIPCVLFFGFFGVYYIGNKNFAHIFNDFELNFNAWELIVLCVLGFVLSFNYWNFHVFSYFKKWNNSLLDDYLQLQVKENNNSLFSTKIFINSTLISLISLCLLLLIFLGFNFNDLIQFSSLSAKKLSERAHESVFAVIVSLLMAVFVILFFFRQSILHGENTRNIKLLAKVWIMLNFILLVFTAFQNFNYINELGLTYKRLGVIAFLFLCSLGLLLAWLKIINHKTNYFLFRQMAHASYGLLILCTTINWGYVLTEYNLKYTNFDVNYHLLNVEFNKQSMLDFAKSKNDVELVKKINKNLNDQKEEKVLSKILYFETN